MRAGRLLFSVLPTNRVTLELRDLEPQNTLAVVGGAAVRGGFKPRRAFSEVTDPGIDRATVNRAPSKIGPPDICKTCHLYQQWIEDERMLTSEDVAIRLGLSIDAVYVMRKNGAPFPFGKTRLKWINEFLRTRPDLQIKSIPSEV